MLALCDAPVNRHRLEIELHTHDVDAVMEYGTSNRIEATCAHKDRSGTRNALASGNRLRHERVALEFSPVAGQPS